ncbi:hypothetical protein Tco_0242088 [Tanacetum coccineum]
MSHQETQQVDARNEKWVPFTKRVKISSTNVRLETIVPQKEETFQVVIDLIKNSSCFKAFTISTDVPEIFMQHFWYSIKKEGLAFEIDHMKEKRSRRENMPFPRFTKIIINHFLKQHKSLSNLKYQYYHIIKDDGILKSYQMFIKYSTGQIPPKKSRGKCSQRKKIADDSQETIDVSEEYDPEPKLVKRKTASRRVVKKKVTIFVDDNIISDDPDVALELGKSISKIEAEKAEAARQVHATHARIMTEYVHESAKKKFGGKFSRGVPDESTIVSVTSSEGTGIKLRVPDKEKDITKENVILEWGSNQESKYSEEDQLDGEEKDDKEGDADDEGNDHISDAKDTDDEDDETESYKDEIYKYKICVCKDEDEEMLNAEAEDSKKGNAEVSDAAKAAAKKTEEAKDDSKKAELPPTCSSLSISSGFGDQFLKLSSDTSLVSTVKDTTDAEISSVPVSVISEPIFLTPVQETPSTSFVITLPLSSVSTTQPTPQQTTTLIPPPPITTDALIITSVVSESDLISTIKLRVAKLEKDVSELKKIDLSAKALPELPKNQTPTVDLE